MSQDQIARTAETATIAEHRRLNDVATKAVTSYLTDGTTLIPDTSDQTALRVDNTTTASAVYIGTAPIGTATSAAAWQIQKLDTSSGVVIKWANASNAFNTIWDNRASLSYT